uniref:Protein E6 n=1 Tax=Human papillomavirus TaxID=10566 RepID=A0A385PKZ4_9PAPI|nr:MAG: E6 protein [Human papillomavirus]
MAGLHPLSLSEYCALKNVSLFDVSLCCVFCKNVLDFMSLADFHVKGLQLLHKGDTFYACCAICLKVSAKYELDNYFQCYVHADYLTTICEKPLQHIFVRCIECYKLLDCMEKLDCCAESLPYCLIRGRWRNYCRNCIRKL